VQGDYEFHGIKDEMNNIIDQLTLDDGTAISADQGATLAIDANETFKSDLALNLAGSTTMSGDGGLVVSTQTINYPNLPPGKLRPITINTGTATLGNSTAMKQTRYVVESGSTLVVPADQNPQVGSLTGGGAVEVGDFGPANSLSINTPEGETDAFSGSIEGQGGTIEMEGQGSLTIGSINPTDAGAFPLQIDSGMLLVSNSADAQTLQVASNATFGGPGTINCSGKAFFSAGATFAATLGGTASGEFTRLNNDDQNAADGGTGIVLTDGSILAVNLAPGYVPNPGESFTIVALSAQNASNPYIQGQFANAPDGATRSFGGVPFLVSYNQDPNNPGHVTSITLTAESFTTDTWVWNGPGNGDGTSWTDPGNWSEGVPAAGATVVFPALPAGHASPAIINITGPNGSPITAEVSSIAVLGDYEFHGIKDVNNNIIDQLTLDDGTALSADPAATLAIDKDGDAPDLALNLAGTTTMSGDGGLVVSTQTINYPNLPPGKLRPILINTGTVTLGNSPTMKQTRYVVEPGSMLVVPADQNPQIGSLSGGGTVEVGDFGPANSLSINTPEGESDNFSGSIEGQGGTIEMEGQGSLTIGSIIPTGSGALQLRVDSGALLVSNTATMQTLQVASNATFGGPGTTNVSVQAVFSTGSTFAATLGGTASGEFTQLNYDDLNNGGTGVLLTGSNLAVNLAPGYVPNPGDPFTIVAPSKQNTPNPYIQGQFANAPDGSTRSFGGIPFLVSYNQDPNNLGNVISITLTAESFTVGVDAGSSNPSTYGQSVQFDATVAVPGDSSIVPTGLVQFFDGDPSSGGTPIGAAQPLDASGEASVTTTTLFALASPHQIYAVYTATGDLASSTTQVPVAELINPAPLTITAQDNTKSYDGTTGALALPTFQVTGLPPLTLFNGDTLTGLSETYDTKNVGTGKTLSISPGYTLNDGNGGNNYQVTLVANSSGEIDARTLTVTAQENTKTYDGTTSAAATPMITAGALAAGDTPEFTESYSTRNVGTDRALIPGGSVNDGNGGKNYLVTFDGSTDGEIDKAALLITAQPNTKTYDGTTSASAIASYGGLQPGDTLTGLSETYANKNVGKGKTLSVSPGYTLNDGNGGNNYQVTVVANTSGEIDARKLTVTAQANTKTYDGTTSAGATPMITAGALAAGDTADFTESYSARNVGTGLALFASGNVNDGNGGNNYQVTVVANTSGEIDARKLTVTAQANTKTYDGTTSAAATPMITAGALAAGDTPGFTESYSTRNVGTGEALIPGGKVNDGNGGKNYQVTFDGSTNGEIDKAALLITAQPNTKTYDGTISASAIPSYSGIQPGDMLTGLIETYDTSNVGTGKTLSISPGYTLNDGNGGNNYQVTLVANTRGEIDATPTTVRWVRTPITSIKRKSERVIVLQFSAALNAADAQSLATYSLVTVPPSKRQKSKTVALKRATYDPTAFTVTLFTRKPLVLQPPLRLTITAARLLDALGRPLAGNHSGQPGTNFSATLSKSGATVTSVKVGRAAPLAARAVDALLGEMFRSGVPRSGI
jgi:hypothetical protein